MYQTADLDARIDALLARVGLLAQRDSPVRTYSRGQAQRAAIARALLHDPDVLLMDEPYTGLDQDAAAVLDQLIVESCARGRAVLLTTHNVEHGWHLSQRSGRARASVHISFLVGGRIRFSIAARETDPGALRELYARALKRTASNGKLER
jgi:heme exporter protein A